MSTPTLRMLERQMAFKRQQEEARANRPPPTPDDLYRGARKFLRHDPATARRFAGLEDPAPFVPPTVESPPPDWRSIAGGLMRNIEEMYQQSMQRSTPRTLEDDGMPAAPTAASVPTPAPPPATSKPTPAEVAIHRDLDGRATHAQVGDQQFRFQRRDGRIERADSDSASIVYQRDHTGRISGARIEKKDDPI